MRRAKFRGRDISGFGIWLERHTSSFGIGIDNYNIYGKGANTKAVEIVNNNIDFLVPGNFIREDIRDFSTGYKLGISGSLVDNILLVIVSVGTRTIS